MTLFSKIIAGEIPSYKIAETNEFFAFLDIHPLRRGHTLVIPKKEVDELFDLDDETYVGLMIFARIVASAIKRAVPCKRIGVTVIGLEVPHAHVHFIPIDTMDDMDFGREKLQLSKEEFEETAEAIRKELAEAR